MSNPAMVLLSSGSIAADTSGSATFTLGSLDQGYKDLIIYLNVGTDANSTTLTMRVNGDTSSNYNWVQFYSRANSQTLMEFYPFVGSGVGNQANFEITLPQYNSRNGKYQIIQNVTGARGDADSTAPNVVTGYWRNTSSPVTSVTFGSGGGFNAGTYQIYGRI